MVRSLIKNIVNKRKKYVWVNTDSFDQLKHYMIRSVLVLVIIFFSYLNYFS